MYSIGMHQASYWIYPQYTPCFLRYTDVSVLCVLQWCAPGVLYTGVIQGMYLLLYIIMFIKCYYSAIEKKFFFF